MIGAKLFASKALRGQGYAFLSPEATEIKLVGEAALHLLALSLADEFGAQDQSFDGLMPAVDLFGVLGEAD